MALVNVIGYAASSAVAHLFDAAWTPQLSCLCVAVTPVRILLITVNSSALKVNIVRATVHASLKVVKVIKCATAWMKVVCRNRLNCRFSMENKHPTATAHWTSLDVKKYNLLALEIFSRSTK